jgi:hypothetical protein
VPLASTVVNISPPCRVERPASFRVGSRAAVRYAENLVRFALQSRLRRFVGNGPLRANNGLMHRSKMYLYSSTSSARPISALGTLTPRALAVLRFMISSTLVPCWTGKSAGLSPLRTRPV